MLLIMPTRAVRFGTEKSIGFPRLTAIFEHAVTRDSLRRNSSFGKPWGRVPRIMFGLAKC
jgi:hypothetical protein